MIHSGLQPGCGQPNDVIVVIVEARIVRHALRVVGAQVSVNGCVRMVIVAFVNVFRRKRRPDADVAR